MSPFRLNARRLHHFGIGLFVQGGKNMFGKNIYGIFFHVLFWELYIGIEVSKRF